MKQKDAVFQAVSNTVELEDGASVSLSKEQRETVVNILAEGFLSGQIDYQGTVNPDEIRGYCSGLLSNWLRKDTRLNGGVKYEAKNPGSRAGNSDPAIRAMRTLMSTKTEPSEIAEIQSFIDKRLAEIKPA